MSCRSHCDRQGHRQNQLEAKPGASNVLKTYNYPTKRVAIHETGEVAPSTLSYPDRPESRYTHDPSAGTHNFSMTEHISVAADLEALLAGALNASDFRRKYEFGSDSMVLNAIWDNLQHYLADADIRARDESYREMQDNELQKLIQLLRQDAPVAQLRRITFLTVT